MSETEPCLQPGEEKASIPGCRACEQSAIRSGSPQRSAATQTHTTGMKGRAGGEGGGGRQRRQTRCLSSAALRDPAPQPAHPGSAGGCSACPRSRHARGETQPQPCLAAKRSPVQFWPPCRMCAPQKRRESLHFSNAPLTGASPRSGRSALGRWARPPAPGPLAGRAAVR